MIVTRIELEKVPLGAENTGRYRASVKSEKVKAPRREKIGSAVGEFR